MVAELAVGRGGWSTHDIGPSDRRNGEMSTRISSVSPSRMVAMGNDWATEWPNEYSTVRAIGEPAGAANGIHHPQLDRSVSR
jgi:hypothetical protein